MANETRAGTSAAPVPDFSMPATKVYRAGGGRKLFYAAVFLVLMPFFLSLPAMFIQRVVYGVWVGHLGPDRDWHCHDDHCVAGDFRIFELHSGTG